jgi:hypothetical protein
MRAQLSTQLGKRRVRAPREQEGLDIEHGRRQVRIVPPERDEHRQRALAGRAVAVTFALGELVCEPVELKPIPGR